jgi:hypothetical protein
MGDQRRISFQAGDHARPTRERKELGPKEGFPVRRFDPESFKKFEDGCRGGEIGDLLAAAFGGEAGQVLSVHGDALAHDGSGGSQEPLFPQRHGPISGSLIEKGLDQPNQGRMNDGIEVDGILAMEESLLRSGWARGLRRGSFPDAFAAHFPEILWLVRGEGTGGGGVQISPERVEQAALFHLPEDVSTVDLAHPGNEEGFTELAPGELSWDDWSVSFPGEHGINVLGENASSDPLFLVVFLGEIGLGVEDFGGLGDGFLEGEVLEGVEGVVMDENPDGSLGREVVGGLFEGLSKVCLCGEGRLIWGRGVRRGHGCAISSYALGWLIWHPFNGVI